MPIPTDERLLEDVAHDDDGAKSLKSLYALYGLRGHDRVALRRQVKRLAADGRLVRLRGGQRYGVPRRRESILGLLQGTSRGFGFVSPDDPALPDVLVPEQMLHGALHGDRVEVEPLPDTPRERPAGRILRVVERRDSAIVGLFVRGDRRRGVPHSLRPFDPRVSVHVVIPDRFTLDAEDGVFVAATLLRDDREGASDGPLHARVTAVLGRPEEPGTDVRVIVRSFGLSETHAPAAVAEAERRAARGIGAAEIARRADLRSLRTVTIDGETARDFDDAVSVEPPRRKGSIARLHVHIADVAAHVEEGTALDAEARERATSVYFPDRALHMLPEALSAGACSLRPGEDRLAVTVSMDIDASGGIHEPEIRESVVRSDRRMTYTAFQRILVDRDEALRREHRELLDDFETMGRLAEALVRVREQRGGLDFDLPVPIVKVDEDGLPTEITPSQRNVAHRVIEEFMIAANRVVARQLHEAGEPSIYRNHDAPPADKVEAFREAAAAFGHELRGGSEPAPKDFADVLAAAAGRPEEPLLTMMTLRSMSLARYDTELRGHFGLALEHYTHFTSPIRRYPDLVVHRAIKRLLHGDRVPGEDVDEVISDIAEDAAHCSRAERNAEAAERALVAWKTCLWARERIDESFDARVTAIAERGIVVVLTGHVIEGFVRFQDLREDWYERDARGVRIVGQRTGRVLRLGDRVQARIVHVDLLTRRIEMEEA